MQPDQAVTTSSHETTSTPGLEAAISCILDAVNKTEVVLNHLWESVKEQYIAAEIEEPFPDFIQRRISRFDLITILRAVFSQTWDKIKESQGKLEISRRHAAASRLGLQEHFELFLWFGSAVKSQRTWRVIAGQKELPSARDLYLKLEAFCRERRPYLHPLQLDFQPRDFEQVLRQNNVEQSQARSLAIEAPKRPDTSTDSDKEPEPSLTTVISTSEATEKCTTSVVSRQVTTEAPTDSTTSDGYSAQPPRTQTRLNASALLSNISIVGMSASDCDDSAIGLDDKRPEVSDDEEGPKTDDLHQKGPEILDNEKSLDTNNLQEKNFKHGAKKGKSALALRETAVASALRDIRVHFEGSLGKVDALKSQRDSDAEAYTAAMKKHREAIVADLDAMENSPHTVAPDSIDGYQKMFRHAAGQKRKAVDAADELSAKKTRMTSHLATMYGQIDEAMELYAKRAEEEMDGVGGGDEDE